MTVVITQTCDRCGKNRTLRVLQEKESAGWRELDAGTICADCIREVFDAPALPEES